MPNQISHNALIGKLVIIGISFYDSNENLIEIFQTHGIVEKTEDSQILQIRKNDNGIFQLPFYPETIQEAPSGEYSEKSSSTIITKPDYMILWDLSVKDQEIIDKVKEFGYLI